jgi:hypothetical protein
MADNSVEAILRIHNDPKLTSGEKMRKIAALTGTQFHPAGPAYAELIGRARATGGQKRTGNYYTQRSKP